MTLTFVTRGYVTGQPTPLAFTQWGYLYQETIPPEPEPIGPTPAPPTPVSASTVSRRKPVRDDLILREDAEILQLIELFIKHKILR